MEETPAVVPVTPVPKSGGVKKLLKIALPIVIVLAAAGAGGWWWLGRSTVAAAEQEPPLAERGLVTFEPFLVNLADAGGTRFLKVNVQLVVASAEQAKHLQETPVVLMQLRSGILELLTQQSAPALVTAAGKQDLKTAIKAHVGTLLAGQKVIDVLFSEFVVQF